MKRLICICLTALLCMSLCSCAELNKRVETDYAAAIMVEGEIYLKAASPMPAEIDPSAIIGYTDSYTDTFPKKDGETNFNRELDMPYARVEGGIAVLYENEWYLCTPMNADAKPVESNKVYGTAVFYDGSVKEAQASKRSITVGHSVELTQEQADKLKAVVDNVDEWTDDHTVDRLAYWFDGHFEFADREFEYYFTYQYNVIYYDHYFAEIPEDDMRFIMELNPGGSEKPSEGSGEDAPFYVISDGKRVAPHVEFAYSREWTEHGWLYADGVDWSIDFSQIYMELPVPVVSLTEDFAVEYGKGVDFYNVSVYDAEFEQLYNNMDFSCLNELSDGDYYIGISVNIDGKYIESEGESEYTGLVGIYKLEKYGADHIELSGDAAKKSTATFGHTTSADRNDQPPELRVGASETITALRGTSSWYYLNADGTSTGVESDSVHPLDAKQYMPGLDMTEGRIEFFFETMPDEITAECWPVSAWGNPEAEPYAVPVDTVWLEIIPGGYIYEITAKWDRPEYGGTARYSFYTSPLGIELTAKDISPTGLTLVCTQSDGKPDGELMTGAAFRLQTYNEELGFWEDMSTKNELIFTSEAWQIPINSSVEWKTDLELYYGELSSGRYRIFKEIMDFRGTGDFDRYDYFAEFKID